jgi:hypothetical protein
MNKSPMQEAIEILERFNENLDFSKEGKTAVKCSISLLEPLLEKERKLYISMCFTLIEKLADIVDRGEFDKFDEDEILDFIRNFFIEKQKPIYGSYEHLLSLGQGRSKN